MEDLALEIFNDCCLIVQGCMQLAFVGRFSGKTVKLPYLLTYLGLIVTLDWVCQRLQTTAVLAIAVEMLILYAVNRLALHNSRSISGAAVIIAVDICQLSFGLVNSVEVVFFPSFLGRPLLYLALFLATAAAFLICAGFYAAVLRLLSLPAFGQTPYIGLLLLPSLFFFAAEMYITQTVYTVLPVQLSPAEVGRHAGLLFLQFGGLGALLCTLYAYQRICRGFQAQAELQSLTQAVQAQKAYIGEARLRYEQTRAFRHDIKNHLSVLGGLLRREDWAAALEYLEKLDAASAALSFPYQTGNSLLDILLAEKLGLAGAEGITAEVELILPRHCAVDDFDLCVIFANALDNAVNACRSLTGEKFIRVSGEMQGDFYLLCFENTCSEQPLPPSGTGLANIRKVAEKYRGAVQIEKEESRFCLNVLLDMTAENIS